MYQFMELTLSFPVVIFSLFLALTIIYWSLVCCGVLDIEPVEIHLQTVWAYDQASADVDRKLLSRLGLDEVPLSVILTLISLNGWLVSYLFHLALVRHIPYAILYYSVGLISGIVSLLMALATTALIVRLSRPLLRKITGPPPRPICGQIAVVKSARVTAGNGTALLNDGGAGLLLQVRALGNAQFKRNDRVVLLRYIAEEHVYQVISELEFKG